MFINGECPTTGDKVDRVTQRLYIRLRTFFQEWYLNSTYGVPWLEKILGHKGRKSSTDMIIQEQILGVRGVAKILEFNSSLERGTRNYTCSFRVKVDTGETSPMITISS